MQLEFHLPTKPTKNTTLIVDCGVYQKKRPIINIGLQYAATALKADTCHWKDDLDISQYDTIGFSVCYVTFICNIVPWLKRHGIEPLKDKRSGPRVIVGGKGVGNINGALDDIVDETFYGEADGKPGNHIQDPLVSPPVIQGKRAIIEVTRGCKYRCSFCEYAHVLGGKYREKPCYFVTDEIRECAKQGIRQITLRSANLAGYENLDYILEACEKYGIHQGFADAAPVDIHRIVPWISRLRIKSPMIGIESFDEATRLKVGGGKRMDDDALYKALHSLCEAGAARLRLYLIYGLPGDKYESWYEWVMKLVDLRTSFPHPIRIDFSITNLNACAGTPLANAPRVDFEKKVDFLTKWIQTCKTYGFYANDWEVRQGNDYGMLGRSEGSYEMTMALRDEGAAFHTQRLLRCNGVGRSIRPKQAESYMRQLANPTV